MFVVQDIFSLVLSGTSEKTVIVRPSKKDIYVVMFRDIEDSCILS